MPTIAPGVDFTCVAREWRCKFTDANDMAALKAAQKLLDSMTVEILEVVHEFVGKQAISQRHAPLRAHLQRQIDSSADARLYSWHVALRM